MNKKEKCTIPVDESNLSIGGLVWTRTASAEKRVWPHGRHMTYMTYITAHEAALCIAVPQLSTAAIGICLGQGILCGNPRLKKVTFRAFDPE
jgi:hypothetical protein